MSTKRDHQFTPPPIRSLIRLIENAGVAPVPAFETVIDQAVAHLLSYDRNPASMSELKDYLPASDDEDEDEAASHDYLWDDSGVVNHHSEEELQEALSAWAHHECSSAYYKLRDLGVSGGVEVWRVIHAPPNWKPGGRPLGMFWSWDRRTAQVYDRQDSNTGIEWLLHGTIANGDIDWPRSIAMNADTGFREETEITLRKGGHILLHWYSPLAQPKRRIKIEKVMESNH